MIVVIVVVIVVVVVVIVVVVVLLLQPLLVQNLNFPPEHQHMLQFLFIVDTREET